MLRNRIIKKILISTAALFTLFLVCLIPDKEYEIDTSKVTEYVDSTVMTNNIYLLNSNNLLGRTSVVVNYDNTIDKAFELLNVLIIGGEGESLIPSGFKSIIPSDTTILGIDFKNGLMSVNFSNELLNIDKSHEVSMIESIIYTLTEIEDVKEVNLYVDGNPLTILPKTNTILSSSLNRKFGINKQYDITSLNNINQVTVYYIDKNNDDYYYVPVTKYVNDDREKIKIIIEDLTSSKIYSSNLMSFLNSNTELLEVQNENNIMELTFNNYILSNFDKKDILEEVIYTICLSIKDNYDVEEVIFNVENEEIYKSVLKTIE